MLLRHITQFIPTRFCLHSGTARPRNIRSLAMFAMGLSCAPARTRAVSLSSSSLSLYSRT
jgi:hypothetical protein